MKDHLFNIKDEKMSRKDFLKLGLGVLAGITATTFIGGCKDTATGAGVPMAQYANFYGDSTSKVYHMPTCKLAPKTSKAVMFDSPVAAQNYGYRPCSVCHPNSP
ncbi:MAG: hypothetical protein LWY06_05860 [Firmicutes bacterium]|nr:hypothetical protein [Bacillota bacterium]